MSFRQKGLESSLDRRKSFGTINPLYGSTVEGDRGVDTYGVIEGIVQALRSTLQDIKSTELRYWAVDFFWPQVAIVPLVRKKLIFAHAWRIDPLVIASVEEVGSWHYQPHELPADICKALELKQWGDARLNIGLSLCQSVAEMAALAGSVRDLRRLPELDEIGFALVQEHIDVMSGRLSATCQTAIDAATEMLATCNPLSDDELLGRPNLMLAMEAIKQLNDLILLDVLRDKAGMTVNELFDWASNLEGARGIAFLAWLYWADDVLSTAQSE